MSDETIWFVAVTGGEMYRQMKSWVTSFVNAVDAAFGGEVGVERSPADADYETLARAVLVEAGSLDLTELIERIAWEAMRIETTRGAWATDVGLWGPDLFRREATTAVRRMIGHSLALDCEGSPTAIPVFG